MELTSGTIEKLIPVKQYLSAGNRIPYFSGISGNGCLFFSRASSNKNYTHTNESMISLNSAMLTSFGGGVVNE